ncbi:PREDICTED: hepatocyte growth factor activator isoform X1 [Cyprinodon variegatus]|uniref:hepatocyte growth factor activator isoform X1 n=1 Tax=Cyprinodon variegatus TaxID=28743 RepID=UPI00074274AF|nr:PREDICTED: hepatocyte growth factor activator isoform X1 [Cyprinodon variegatus]
MAYITLAFLLLGFTAGARMLVFGSETGFFNSSKKVLTTSGKECKFPFRQGGRIHYHCITIASSKPWCSLTHNFDRDRQWGLCAQSGGTSRRGLDPCRKNPCENGGVCTAIPQTGSFQCSCPEKFTGTRCEQKKCYEAAHLRHYDIGESWGRIHLRNVEQCTCEAGEISCQRVHYRMCRRNPCKNQGTCRLITSTGKEVCFCKMGYSGPDCSLVPETECYKSRGMGYRGVVGTTESGARCLPWNSDLLFDELHVGVVNASAPKGLGDHAFCRNPDGDSKPWCYTVTDSAISWEYCNVPSCVMSFSSSRRIIPLNALPHIKKPASSKPAKKPVCGVKHKKRLAVARGRIFGGNAALPGTHPWMAAIYIGQSDFCGGSLISSCWVLSAAHCFFSKYATRPLASQLKVVLGQHHFNVTGPNTKEFEVEDYHYPKEFSVFNPTLHDIVLIKLKKKDGRCVRRTPFIRPICLPEKSMKFPPGYCCSISGWGHTKEKANGYSTLQEAGVRLVSHDVCKKPQVYGNHVTDDMICAGLSGCVDACQGDSGGPLACAKGDVSFLYGIISWGEGCDKPGKPGVYTKVVNYLDWIHSAMKRKKRTL